MKLLTIKIGTEEVQVDPELYREFCLLFYNCDGKNTFKDQNYFYDYLKRQPKPYFLVLDSMWEDNHKLIVWIKERNINNVIEKILS